MSNSYVQLPTDGAGKKVYTNQQIVSGVTVQIQGINVVSGDDATKSLTVDSRGTSFIKYFEGEPNLGSYGDTKTLETHIIGVYEHTVDSYDDLYTVIELSGGTSVYDVNESSMILSVTNDIDSKCTRITNRYHYYQHGITFLVIITCACGDFGKVNNKRQWGLFDEDSGFLFELSGTTINVVLKSFLSDLVVPQSEWNVDKLDGTGKSGVNLDITKSYQYFIAINYPSNVASFGVYAAEKGRVICHKINAAGRTPFPSIKHMSLPIQFNNENIGITGSDSELREIISVILSEGEPDYTFWRFADLGCTNRSVTINSPIFSIRPKILLDSGGHNHINSFPESMSVYSTGNIKIQVVSHNGTILSGETFSIQSLDGPLEADITATSIDINSDQYWIMKTYYIEKDMATNLNLSDMYELNDEGCLLSFDHTQNTISYVATSLDADSATVTLELSYRSLY